MTMIVCGVIASACVATKFYGAALQASLIAISSAMYGAAYIIKERND